MVVTLSKSPDKAPELKSEVIVLEGRREVGRERIDVHPEIRELFAWYVEYMWEPWALAERPRRKTISRYNQLFSLQQAISSEGAETPLELAWGIGYAVWKKDGFGTPVKYPLLVQVCEVTLNEKTFDLEVRPRDVEPKLDADCREPLFIECRELVLRLAPSLGRAAPVGCDVAQSQPNQLVAASSLGKYPRIETAH